MIVEILCGGYGCPTKTGVHTVSRGERCEVSDAEAARLIGPRKQPLQTFRQLRKVTTPLTRKPRRAARRRPPLPPTSCAA